MGNAITVLKEHREQQDEITRLMDLFHAINGRLIALREIGAKVDADDTEQIERWCREALNYPTETFN